MPASNPQDVTQLLLAWNDGDQAALDQLMPIVYDELHRVARRHLRRERAAASVQTTALVHEVYLRLVDVRRVEWQGRAHFFAIAARVIRQILVDLARQRGYKKRGGGVRHVELDESRVGGEQPDEDLAALDEALQALAELDQRKSQVVELRFFGGLTEKEIAEVLDVSPETVKRDWRFSRAWLKAYLSEDRSHDSGAMDKG
jgi:RNA polymerase sigma factor (TIGR02999 family)